MQKMDISSRRIFQGDTVIWVVFFLLCMISLIEVFSAASTLTYKSGDFMAPFFKQLLFLGLGTGVAWFFHAIPCRYFKIIPLFFLPLCIVLLLVTLFFGSSENGGARWLDLGIRFQPSELAKGVVIVSVALILSHMQREEGADRRAFKLILTITGIVCTLIVSENLSTAAILFTTVFIMMFIGRVPMQQLGRLIAFFAAIIAFFVLLVTILPQKAIDEVGFLHRMETWKSRITSHTQDTTNDTLFLQEHAQEAHANIAIASSNIVGKMPGNSDQRDHLSQAFSDFIYAIIIEEMGIFGALLVLFLYIILLFRAGRISSRCERSFPAFLTMGLALLLVIQAMINMLVAVGLIPITGQPLPLISRGGTSTLITCVYFGMMLSVSRYARKNDIPAQHDNPSGADSAEQAFHSNEGLA